MKATGIVRRIDDLGRVVIPKEIRRTLRIREGDPLEIFTSNDGEVIFKKYSPIGELSAFAAQYADILHKTSGKAVIVCDRDHVVAAAGVPKKELLERRISPALEQLCDQRKSYILSPQEHPLYPVEGIERTALIAFPIISAGDVCGSVVLLGEDSDQPSEAEEKLLCAAAGFLGNRWKNNFVKDPMAVFQLGSFFFTTIKKSRNQTFYG